MQQKSNLENAYHGSAEARLVASAKSQTNQKAEVKRAVQAECGFNWGKKQSRVRIYISKPFGKC